MATDNSPVLIVSYPVAGQGVAWEVHETPSASRFTTDVPTYSVSLLDTDCDERITVRVYRPNFKGDAKGAAIEHAEHMATRSAD